MRIINLNIFSASPQSPHDIGKKIRHASDRLIGHIPVMPQHRRHEQVMEGAKNLIQRFAASQVENIFQSNKTALDGIMTDPPLDEVGKLEEIRQIVCNELATDQIDGEIKKFAVGNAFSDVIRREARYQARENPGKIQSDITHLIFIRLRPPMERTLFSYSAAPPPAPANMMPTPIFDERGKKSDDDPIDKKQEKLREASTVGLSRNSSISSKKTLEDPWNFVLLERSTSLNQRRCNSPSQLEDIREDEIGSATSTRGREKSTAQSFASARVKFHVYREYSAYEKDDSGSRTVQREVLLAMSISGRTVSGSSRRNTSYDNGIPSIQEHDGSALPFPNLKDSSQTFEDKINSGALGTIYKAALAEGQKSSDCVIKRFSQRHQDEGWVEYDNNDYVRQMLAQDAGKQFIAEFLGACTIGQENEIILAFEYIDGPTLGDMFDAARDRLTGSELLALARYAILGPVTSLASLEKAHVAHNDVKINNLLFDKKMKAGRLIDLGNAAVHNHFQPFGHASYTPPERARAIPFTKYPGMSEEQWENALEDRKSQFIALQPEMREKELALIARAEQGAIQSPELLSASFAWTTEVRQEKSKKDTALVSDKTDPFGIGQVLHYLVEGHAFSLLDREPQTDLERTFMLMNTTDAFRERGQVFLDNDQTNQKKTDTGYYDFVNKAMNPDPTKRHSCIQLLNHPFLRNAPSIVEVEAILSKIGL